MLALLLLLSTFFIKNSIIIIIIYLFYLKKKDTVGLHHRLISENFVVSIYCSAQARRALGGVGSTSMDKC